MNAIEQVESGGNCQAKGASGEIGSLQYMPTTWALYSTEILGYVAPMNCINGKYVAAKMVAKWLNQGLTPRDIAAKWNQGDHGPCRAGINSKGVQYDSCAYIHKVLAYAGGVARH